MAVEILVTSFTFPFSLETSINRRKEKKKDWIESMIDSTLHERRNEELRLESNSDISLGIIIEIRNKTREFTKWIEFDFAPDTRTLN